MPTPQQRSTLASTVGQPLPAIDETASAQVSPRELPPSMLLAPLPPAPPAYAAAVREHSVSESGSDSQLHHQNDPCDADDHLSVASDAAGGFYPRGPPSSQLNPQEHETRSVGGSEEGFESDRSSFSSSFPKNSTMGSKVNAKARMLLASLSMSSSTDSPEVLGGGGGSFPSASKPGKVSRSMHKAANKAAAAATAVIDRTKAVFGRFTDKVRTASTDT
jgi:hypothetical protein